MKKSKIISLLLLMTLFSFIMETEKQARKKWDQVKEVVIAKIYSDSTDSTINLTSDQLISEAEY